MMTRRMVSRPAKAARRGLPLAFPGLLLALVLGLAPPVPAAAQTVPESRAEMQLSFAPLVKRVAPAVVNIYAKQVVQAQAVSPLFADPFFQRFFGGLAP